jgi:flagellar basal body P-ring protein FlgI
VHAGTINQAQADVLDAGIRAGSIDDAQLVANGTLSSEQMHAVDNRLIAVKQSLAPMHTDNAPSRPAGKAAMASGTASAAGTGCGAPAGDKGASSSSADPGPGPFLAAVAHLVQAGTINQAQADVLDAGIRAGSIDDAQLVANGTLSSAQMQAVDARLRSVKESLASRAGSSQVDKAAVRKRSQH